MLQADKNPWLGLASYEYNDAYRFFGREEELSELKTAICNNLFTTIYGISGAGKTSLINAGMMPLLEKESYLPVRVRLDHKSKVGYNSQIIKAIVSTLENTGGEVESENVIGQEDIVEEERLWNFLFTSQFWSKYNRQVTPVIFIDQFEEIFTNNESEETIRNFFEVINSLQYSIPPTNTSSYLEKYEKYVDYNDVAQLRIVLIMREDFLARLEDYSFNIPALRKNRRGIKRMNGLQALDVILKPMPDIVTRDVALSMLSKVTGKIVKDSPKDLVRTTVDTSILSLFCSELYQKAVLAQQSTLTEELVSQFGDNIISSFYDDTMGLISPKTMEYLESHLLTYSGFRNSVALEDLQQNGIKKEDLAKLTEKRLIRIETLDGIERVEFTHDVLCGVAKTHRDLRLQKKERTSNLFYYARYILETTFFTLVLVYFVYFSYLRGSWFVGAIPKRMPAFLLSMYFFYYIYINGIKKQKYNIFKIGVTYFLLFLSSWLNFGPWTIIDINTLGNDNFTIASITTMYIPALILCVAIILHTLYKKVNSKKTSKIVLYLWIISFFILFESRFRILFIIFLSFVFVYVFLPYSLKREINYWKLCLCGIPCVFLISIIDFNREQSTIFILLSVYLLINLLYSYYNYKKKKTFEETIEYCFSFQIYKEHPLLKQYALVLLSLFIYSMLFLIGIKLNDTYTIVLTPILCCILLYLVCSLFIGSSQTIVKEINVENKTFQLVWCKIGDIELKKHFFIFLALIGVLFSQYFIWHLCFMLFFWGISLFFVYKLFSYKTYKQYNFLTNKNKVFLISFVIWGSSVFIGTMMGMGYNVFTLPQYARTWGGTQSNRPIFKFLTIEDNKGMKGIRDRSSIVVPVAYESVTLSTRTENFFVGELGFPYSLEKGYAIHPWIIFLIEPQKNVLAAPYWECSDHLDLDNMCTDLYINYYSNAIINNEYDLYPDDCIKYVDYLLQRGTDSIQIRSVIEKIFINSLADLTIRYSRYNNEEALSPFTSLEDVRKNCSKIEAEYFYKCLENNEELFTKTNSILLSRLLIDTLLVKCKNYNNLGLIRHSELSRFRIFAKDYDYAFKDAQIATSKHDRYGVVRQIEALYFQGKIDNAINLLVENKQKRIPVDKSDFYHYSEDDVKDYYKYLGDQVWQDINEYMELGIIQDTLSQNFCKLKQCLIEESKTPDYDFAEPIDHLRYAYIKTYWDNKNLELYTKEHRGRYRFLKQGNKIVSPCMFSFSIPLDNAISVIIDANDTKRKFLDFSEYTPKLMQGSYDHAWRFSEGLAAVTMNNKIGFIDKNGSFVIHPQYPYPHYDCWETYFSYNGKEIRLDKYNNIRIDFIFEQGQCVMSGNNKKYGIIDKQGKWILKPIYDKIGSLLDNHRQVKIGEKYGLVDFSGNIVVPVKYNWGDIKCGENGWMINSIPLEQMNKQ